MENNNSAYIISVVSAFVLAFLLSKIKRNIESIYYIDIRGSFVCFSISLYFLLLVFTSLESKLFKFSLFITIFSLFFFVLGFFALLEYCKIDGKILIVKHDHQQIRKISIDKIETMKFVKVTPSMENNTNPCIEIITYNKEQITMKSNIENLKGFLEELKRINPNINILNEVPRNNNIIYSILTFIFLFLSIEKILKIIGHARSVT
jgi:Na+/H+-translocating membrane pyrophosphatase